MLSVKEGCIVVPKNEAQHDEEGFRVEQTVFARDYRCLPAGRCRRPWLPRAGRCRRRPAEGGSAEQRRGRRLRAR